MGMGQAMLMMKRDWFSDNYPSPKRMTLNDRLNIAPTT
jgi:hypothetical protein